MKHAIIITAYHDPGQLNRLVANFTVHPDRFGVFIHIDLKSKISPQDIEAAPNVNVFKEYRVNWGGINHLKSLLFLTGKAVEEGGYDYFHWITGQDWPATTAEGFDRLTGRNPGCSYISYFPMPDQWTYRLRYYNFYDVFNYKTRFGGIMIRVLRSAQKISGIRRRMPEMEIYCGSTYCSLTLEAVKYLLDHTRDNPSWMKRCRHTFCAEEMYQHTVLVNSPLKDKLIKDNLRFIVWPDTPTTGPRVLNEKDFEEITSRNPLFIRKINASSARLLGMVEEYKGTLPD